MIERPFQRRSGNHFPSYEHLRDIYVFFKPDLTYLYEKYVLIKPIVG